MASVFIALAERLDVRTRIRFLAGDWGPMRIIPALPVFRDVLVRAIALPAGVGDLDRWTCREYSVRTYYVDKKSAGVLQQREVESRWAMRTRQRHDEVRAASGDRRYPLA
jgi:hypothetical protein